MGEIGIRVHIVIVTPFTEMIGQVKATIIVRAVFEINENQFIVWNLTFRSNEDIPLLQVIVRKYYRTLNLRQELPKKRDRTL